MDKILNYVKVARIDHWFKNVFILAGTLLAIYFYQIPLSTKNLFLILLSLLLASFVASVNYIMNEILDADFDRKHPTKRFRPIPAGKVKVRYLVILAIALLGISLVTAYYYLSLRFLVSLLLLFISGVVYNVHPIRLKEIPLVDVLAESFNNPIRLLIGWFTFSQVAVLPPFSALLAFWFFGGLLMASKRYAEYRFLDDKELSSSYRKSFKFYTEENLLLSMITYANLLFFFYGVFVVVYGRNLVFTLPFILIFIILFFRLSFEKDSIAKEPEKVFRKPIFLAYCLFLALVFWICLRLPENFTDQLNLFRLLSDQIR